MTVSIGLGRVGSNFSLVVGWVGLGWASQLMGWFGSGHTKWIHGQLCSVVLIDSSTDSPVQVLTLSIQTVLGLPRLRAPGIVLCIISSRPLFPHGVTIVC